MNIEFAQTAKKQVISIPANKLNRHGLIAGATGTGKTVTLQSLAERFSREGIPVFMADVKGDLTGLSQAGSLIPKLADRIKSLGISEPTWSPCPVMFWDVFGEKGHPVRTTVTEMGPELLTRLMNLNETQASVLQIIFKIADDSELVLIDLKDVRALLTLVTDNADKFKSQYGHLSTASLGAIQRNLLTLSERGAEKFFGEPALEIQDLIQKDQKGHGYINILTADKLLQSPTVYSTFLLWLLSELFEQLPEVGDLDKPKFVFFFDEAHLLFKDAPKALLEKIEQVVRLIRSKGVGVYFVTQNPMDIPETVLGQLSNRVQHALRAFTPADQKAVKVAAQTMRPNPQFKAEEIITQLSVGEALISVLDDSGAPTIVERAFVYPPGSRIGPANESEQKTTVNQSPLVGHYEKFVDRESAFEVLSKQNLSTASNGNGASAQSTNDRGSDVQNGSSGSADGAGASSGAGKSVLNEILFGTTGPRGGHKPGLVEKAATSAVRSVASGIGREIVRGIMGSLLGGSGGRRRR